MRLSLGILSLVLLHSCQAAYVALAPTEFHPGWTYRVQISVSGTATDTVIVGRIKSTDSNSNADYSSTVTVPNGQSRTLDISIPQNIPLGQYQLKLDGTGGQTFTNLTGVKLNPLIRLTFFQTDKTIYKAGQTIQFRVTSVDKDLIPQRLSYSVELLNPKGSKLAIFNSDMPQYVFEGKYTLAEFPDLGTWTFVAKTVTGEELDTLTFKVDEYVPPKAEVTAVSTPGYLLFGSSNTDVRLDLTAKYTYGKGLMGDYKITIEGSGTTYTGKITDSSGMKSITLPLASELQNSGGYGTISLKVEVTDETGRTYETKASVRIESQPVKISFDEARSEMVYRTGMSLQIVAKITNPDGEPLDPAYLQIHNEVSLSLTDYTNESSSRSQRFTLQPGQTEIVWNITAMTSTANSLNLVADLLDTSYSYQATVYRFKTTGQKALRIQSTYEVLNVGGQLKFTVQTSGISDFTSAFYLLVSRGNIQAAGQVTLGQETMLKVTTDMCPGGRLLVYGITSVPVGSPDKPEVIADSKDLKLTHCQDKLVTPSLVNNQQRTGTNATINVAVSWTDATKTEGVGIHDVYMLGVDKSILLLEGDNDIKPAKVEEGLKKFNLEPISSQNSMRWERSILPSWGGAGDPSTGKLLKVAGIKLMTDLNVTLSPVFPMMSLSARNFVADASMDKAMEGNAMRGGGTAEAAVQTIRKDFPDTWIFEHVMTDQYGVKSLTKTLPDTITSWVISGFAVREGSELAVTAKPYELTAFNPFFVTLNLPYSIRRMEEFELRATVFNYLGEDRKVKVSLTPTADFQIRGEKMFEIDVKDGNAASAVFIIVAKKVGTISLVVQAESAPHSDLVDRKLIVKPEGVERMRAITFPVILTAEQPTFQQEVMLDFAPWTLADVVIDSRRAMVTITGDMMGNALENIDKLLTVPMGCGEQNMITTVPNIFALKYLKAINDVPFGFEEKAKENMRKGYQKETGMYRWPTGGYSAFGVSDENPSTWLTAFVLRSFAQSKEFIGSEFPEYNDMLGSAVGYLIGTEQTDGSFRENGRVIHTEMTGGSSSGDALTVYVTICMLEAKKLSVPVNQVSLNKALEYVRGVYNRVKDTPEKSLYLTSLLAYALALEPGLISGGAMTLLNGINKQGIAPWLKTEEETPDSPVVEPYMYHHPSGPSDIEITAYALLAYNALNDKGAGRDLVLWMQRQQNSQGGYRSTQDTVMALQAISEFAASFRDANPSATVYVETLDPVVDATPLTYTVNKRNAVLLRYMELLDETNKLKIRVTGNQNSLAVVKVVWYFFTAAEAGPTPLPGVNSGNKIVLTTVTKKVRTGFHEVKTCFKPDAGFAGVDTMMLMELQKPTGCMMADIVQARKDNQVVVRLEEKEDVVQMYMNQLTDSCVTVELEEVIPVQNRQAGNVILSSYYDPDTKAEVKVEIEDAALKCKGNLCTVCTDGDCSSSMAANNLVLGHIALAACICLLLSLVLAV